LPYGEIGWVGGIQGAAEHVLFQDFEGAEAVFPGSVGVAADVEAVLGDVVTGQAAGDFLLAFRGRTPCSLMLLVGQAAVSEAKRRTSAFRFRRDSSSAEN
jgi:hypothetical protein